MGCMSLWRCSRSPFVPWRRCCRSRQGGRPQSDWRSGERAQHRQGRRGPANTQADFRYLALVLLLAAGAAGQESGARTYVARDSLAPKPGATEEARNLLRLLAWQPTKFEVSVRPEQGSWTGGIVTFPSPKPQGNKRADTVFMEWYVGKGRRLLKPAPAVLVLHILSGRMVVARAIARGLANQGIHAFVLHLPDYGRRENRARRGDASLFPHRMVQGVADVRRGRDAIAALPCVDAARISVQGTSLGSLAASVAAGIDGAFVNVFLALAGGDLVSVLDKGHKSAAALKRQLQRAHVTREALAQVVARLEPLTLADRLDPQRTWLYSGRSDRVVPKENAIKLARAVGLDAEHHLWVNGNHYTSALHAGGILRHMVEQVHGRPAPKTAAEKR